MCVFSNHTLMQFRLRVCTSLPFSGHLHVNVSAADLLDMPVDLMEVDCFPVLATP